MTYLDDAQLYLGVEFLYTPDGIYFHQRSYIQRLLERFGMQDCNPLSTPMNSKLKLCKDANGNPVDKLTYQSLVGGLLHATVSWWNIQYAVGCVSRHMSNSQQVHLIAAKNILRYLKGTLDYGIFYPSHDNCNLSIFTDADWAGEMDFRSSTFGILDKIGTAFIA